MKNFEHFEALHPRLIGSSTTDPEKALASAEKVLGISFPSALRAITVRMKGATVFDIDVSFSPREPIPLQDETGEIGFELVYGLAPDPNGIQEKFMIYEPQLPDNLVPFGECAGGNLICLDKETSGVVFWLHDASLEDQSVFLVADTVDEFFYRLQPTGAQASTAVQVIKSESYLDF